jgi:aryl-alcohol dehydrogenase-like predicted oxidoreductase
VQSEPEAAPTQIRLGQSPVMIPPMGVGAWAWGDRFFWSYGGEYAEPDVRAAFRASVEAGLTFIDTAEGYGFGVSERLVGKFAAEVDGPLQIATKFFPYPWRLFASQLERALASSLARLGRQQVDLYQIHWPIPPRSVRTWVRGLARVAAQGLVRAVGVSNYDIGQMRAATEELAAAQVPLASNQLSYSLLDRGVERSGLKSACDDQGTTLIAYSPLAQGLLTGKYSVDKPPPGRRGRRVSEETLRRLPRLLDVMREVGEANGGRTLPQVALNWVMAKGAVPIPGAKNRLQATENAGALGWSLDANEVQALDEAASSIRSG